MDLITRALPTCLRLAAGAVLVAALLVTAAPADAARKAITGSLNAKGYRLIALSEGGRATSVRLKGGTFALLPPANTVTLQLRTPGGTYAGPVVAVGGSSRVVVGVRAGARLGGIRLRSGHATVIRRPAARFVDASWTARARNGVPLGARRVGLVRVTLPRLGAPGDRDRDGVPNAIDIDDDGDRILDDYDRPPRRSARAAIAEGSNLEVITLLSWNPISFVNAHGDRNADGTPRDEAQVVAHLSAVEAAGGLMGVHWGSGGSGKLELDCTGLSYCSPGGTGVYRRSDIPPPPSYDDRANRPSFPECCDADRDGMGSLLADPIIPGGQVMFILHGATFDQIRAGDVLIARDTENPGLQFPTSVGFVFASHPVVAAYDDNQGNRVTLSYPVDEACRPLGCQTPVRAAPGGDLVVQFTVWRPQRPRLDTEPGTGRWMDVGNLAYATSLQIGAGASPYCPRSAYTATDPDLVPLVASTAGGLPVDRAFADTSPDVPTEPRGDPSRAFSFTLNLSACFRAGGVATPPGSVLLQLWAWAIGSDYPSTGAAETHSQIGLRLVP